MADSVLLSNIANPKLPEIMTPAQGVELQSMALKLQDQRLQQAQTLAMIGKQQQIQARLSRPDSVGPDGLPTAATLKDISAIDTGVGLDMMGKVEHYRDQKIASQRAADADRLVQMQIQEKVRGVGQGLAEEVVSYVDSTLPKDASPAQKDEAARKHWQELIEERRKSGTYSFIQDDLDPAGKAPSWAGLRSAPVTYSMLKAKTESPQDIQKRQLAEKTAERQEETPDIKNIKAMLKARGMQEGTPAYQKAFADEMKKITTKKEGLTVKLEQPGVGLGTDPDFWYELYDKTGKLPPMAWGQAGNPTREQFLKGFPEWKKKQGGTASDTAASQMSFKANASSLTQVTKDINAFEPYKKMLDTNADIAIQLGRKIQQTAPAIVNKPLNWLRQNATTNPDVAEYLAQMRFVQTEAARVINNPRIVGQLTDESRREMDEVVNGNAPIAVVERVLNRLKSDGTNRFNAMRQQQMEIVDQLKGKMERLEGTPIPGPSGTSASAPKASPVEQITNDYRNGKMTKKQMEDAFYKYYSENPDAR